MPGYAYTEESNKASLSLTQSEMAGLGRKLWTCRRRWTRDRELRPHRPTLLFVKQVQLHFQELIREQAPSARKNDATYIPMKQVEAGLHFCRGGMAGAAVLAVSSE